MFVAGLVFISLMFGSVAYQVVSGKLLDRSWKTFTTRNQRPRLYWSVIAIETAFVLTTSYFVLHDILGAKR